MPPIVTADIGTGPVELGPALSIFDPVHIGIDEFGQPARVPIAGRNMLIGGDPGSGKSALLNAVVAHAALSLDCKLILLDGKRVELGQWKRCAAASIGPDLPGAIALLRRIQVMIDRRTDYLERCERRKIAPGDTFATYLVAIDEIAYFSATVGKKTDREEFSTLLRDVVARGRAVGVPVVAATQRPSSDIIPTSLRDLFAWRFAGRTSTDSSSDIILGHGWVQKGWSANTISPTNPGVGLLIAEGGSPQPVKTAWLDDDTCRAIARYAATLRDTVNHCTAATAPAAPAGAIPAA